MKQYLLPPTGKQYKANMHCHSTVSDGRYTPEEMVALYKGWGYDILALTDHELLVDHSDLSTEDFLLFTGYEYAFIRDNDNYLFSPTLELNIYPRDPHFQKHICFNMKNIIHGLKGIEPELIGDGNFDRAYTLEAFQTVIDAAGENDCLVSLNHPGYSFETPEHFGQLHGLFAMEIYNQESFYTGRDFNFQMYDKMLSMGHKIGVLGGDDYHGWSEYNDFPDDPRPWAHTVIQAESLTHEAVFKALEKGNFYASQGPRITELYIEDGKIHLSCSQAKTIVMLTEFRHCGLATAPRGEHLHEAVFDVPKGERYVRFEVIDAYGRRANTRAYWL